MKNNRSIKPVSALLLLVIILSFYGCDRGNTTSSDTTSVNSTISKQEITSDQTQTDSEIKPSSETQVSSTQVSSTQQESSKIQTSSDSQTSVTEQSGSQQSVKTYKDVECRDIGVNQWKIVAFQHKSGSGSVTLPIPSDWTLTKNNGTTVTVKRNGTVIGTLTDNAPTFSTNCYEFRRDTANELKYVYAINENSNGNDVSYSHVLSFYYTASSSDKRITFEIDYSELSETAVSEIMREANWFEGNVNISGDFTLKNNSKNIAIFGNSFIRSSQIGEFLTQMCNAAGNGYSVTTSAIDMANVGKYSNDSKNISDIESGKYCAVFQCGLYSAEALENLKVVRDACEKSHTLFVVFPAHNEVSTNIKNAKIRYSNLSVVNWKDEIDMLINTYPDLSLDDMCWNDGHKHSSNLAGYVGAHMIYRTLFSKTPPKITGTADCDMSYINNKLGDYVSICENAFKKELDISQYIEFN